MKLKASTIVLSMVAVTLAATHQPAWATITVAACALTCIGLNLYGKASS